MDFTFSTDNAVSALVDNNAADRVALEHAIPLVPSKCIWNSCVYFVICSFCNDEFAEKLKTEVGSIGHLRVSSAAFELIHRHVSNRFPFHIFDLVVSFRDGKAVLAMLVHRTVKVALSVLARAAVNFREVAFAVIAKRVRDAGNAHALAFAAITHCVHRTSAVSFPGVLSVNRAPFKVTVAICHATLDIQRDVWSALAARKSHVDVTPAEFVNCDLLLARHALSRHCFTTHNWFVAFEAHVHDNWSSSVMEPALIVAIVRVHMHVEARFKGANVINSQGVRAATKTSSEVFKSSKIWFFGREVPGGRVRG